MNAYSKFKNNIDEIMDQLDTFLFILDNKKSSKPEETVGSLIESYSGFADLLKKTMQELAEAEGKTLLKDIDYNGKIRS